MRAYTLSGPQSAWPFPRVKEATSRSEASSATNDFVFFSGTNASTCCGSSVSTAMSYSLFEILVTHQRTSPLKVPQFPIRCHYKQGCTTFTPRVPFYFGYRSCIAGGVVILSDLYRPGVRVSKLTRKHYIYCILAINRFRDQFHEPRSRKYNDRHLKCSHNGKQFSIWVQRNGVDFKSSIWSM